MSDLRTIVANAIRSTGHVTNSDKWEVAEAVLDAVNLLRDQNQDWKRVAEASDKIIDDLTEKLRIAALSLPRQSEADLWRTAYYEIAAELGISALAMSPKDAHLSVVVPKIRKLKAASERLISVADFKDQTINLMRGTQMEGDKHRDTLVGNVLDHWENTPNDVKEDMRENSCGVQLDALLAYMNDPEPR
jgi:hypothetical protein